MEKRMTSEMYRTALFVMILTAIGGMAFALGIAFGARSAHAADPTTPPTGPKVIYPKQTELDFAGTDIQGEVRNPGEFYFQRKSEEKFDSLVKRRPNFHREMLRDVVLSK